MVYFFHFMEFLLLTCKKKQKKNRIFDVILNPPVGVSTNDGVAMFNALANNPTANEAAFEFLRTQWDALFSRSDI